MKKYKVLSLSVPGSMSYIKYNHLYISLCGYSLDGKKIKRINKTLRQKTR